MVYESVISKFTAYMDTVNVEAKRKSKGIPHELRVSVFVVASFPSHFRQDNCQG
jgi:hypothetical protein